MFFLSQIKAVCDSVSRDNRTNNQKKLFPKSEKKLKVPSLEHIDEREISYLGWNDQGSNKKISCSSVS
ncbi:hypothetical protein GCM10020331_074890 [Ectobacillus funiculus]